MNKEDIIRMAQEADLLVVTPIPDDCVFVADLERFAHLVYESVFRDANLAASRTILDAAVLEEREACAIAGGAAAMAGMNHLQVAAAIRARGQQ